MGIRSRKRKASTTPAEKEANAFPVPELPDEIVLEILLCVPAKSLLHCRAVCKAWRAIVNDPSFVSAHLRRSASAMRWEQEPSFLVTPVTRDRVIPPWEDAKERGWPITLSNQIRFYRYQWQWQRQGASSDNGHGQQQTARFMYAKDFGAKSTSNRVGSFAHCDGLVLAPTDKKLYLLNPATGEAITLPESQRNNRRHGAPRTCHCVGLGLDPRTGKYKVFQAFYRPVDTYSGIYIYDKLPMGMEVFTLGGDDKAWTWTKTMEDWTETLEDPPYPLLRWQTGVTLKGFIFWLVDTAQNRQPIPRGLVRLTMADEVFHDIDLPEPVGVCDDFTVDALHGQGELCLTVGNSNSDGSVTIWTMPVDDDDDDTVRWEPRYSISIPLGLPPHCHVHVMALVAGGSRMLMWSDFVLYEYDLATSKLSTVCEMDRMRYQGRRTSKWKNLWSFNFVPYTESLLRVKFDDLSICDDIEL